MPKYFVTYGNNLIGHYSVIEAESYYEARAIAQDGTDGGHFAFMYDDTPVTAAMIEKYDLTEVPLQAMG